MSTEQKSFRLQVSRKFFLKTSFHNTFMQSSLNSSIKANKVSSFIKNGTDLKRMSLEFESDESKGLQKHLEQLKQSCSQLNRQIKLKENEMVKFKDESHFTDDKYKKIREGKMKMQETAAGLQKRLEILNLKKQIANHSSKSYEHILERMKKDAIIKQMRKNKLDSEVKTLEKSITQLDIKLQSITQLEKLTQKGLQDAQRELVSMQSTRTQNLQNFQYQLRQKQSKYEKLRQRQKQTEEIHDLGADDILDGDLMKLKKFLSVQLFLKEIIKSKMYRLKSIYEPFENSFFKIKSQTNVKDYNSLKAEFIHFQSSYAEKSSWVRVLQEKLEQAEIQRKELSKQLYNIGIRQIQLIQQVEDRQMKNETQTAKEKLKVSVENELAMQKIKSWVKWQLKRLNIEAKEDTSKELLSIIELLKPG